MGDLSLQNACARDSPKHSVSPLTTSAKAPRIQLSWPNFEVYKLSSSNELYSSAMSSNEYTAVVTEISDTFLVFVSLLCTILIFRDSRNVHSIE